MEYNSTRAAILAVGLLVSSSAVPLLGVVAVAPASAQVAETPGTGAPGAPTPVDEAAGNTTNRSGGGGLLRGPVLGSLGPLGDALKNPVATVANATKQGAHAVLLAVSYVPAPNQMRDYFRSPTNGMWADRWETYQQKARPLFWALAGLTFFLYLLGQGTGTLPRTMTAGWGRRWFSSFAAGYLSWPLAGAWLTARRGLTEWLLQGVTAGGLESTLTAGLTLLALVVVGFTNIWILVVLLLVAGMVYGGVALLTPWLGVLFMARAIPIRIVSGSADRLGKFWFVLTFLTLPIAGFVGAGFSLDVAGQVNPNAFALSSPGTAASEAALALLSVGVKFGSILGGLFASYWLFSGLQSIGMASGVMAAPSADDLQEQYKRGREQAGRARERSWKAVNAPREVVRGAGRRPAVDPSTDSSRSYDMGRAVGDYVSAARPGGSSNPGGQSTDTGTGAERRRRVSSRLAEQRRESTDRARDRARSRDDSEQ